VSEDPLKNLADQITLKELDLKEQFKRDAPLLYWALQYHRNMHGQRMTFKDVPYLIAMYRDFLKFKKLVVEKPAQRGLSEMFILGSFYEAAELGLLVMYVLPKYKGRDHFVSSRIDTVIRRVPAYQRLIDNAGGTSRVALKHFGSGQIAYVGSNVEDEFIEKPMDSIFVDEKDRCNQRNLLMAPDRLIHSAYKAHREISTPTIEGFGINKRIQASTKGCWFIKCDHCGYYFVPGFFENVVRQTGPQNYELCDRDCNKSEEPALICAKCGKKVNRFQKGEFVEEFPNREWVGRLIPSVITPYVTLRDLVNEWMEVFLDAQKRQFFINQRLGLPYSSEGARFSDGVLNKVEVPYRYPIEKVDIKGPLFMGVDVGGVLTVTIRERIKDAQNCIRRRLVLATEVPSFNILKELLREWQPKVCVIDADPEIHSIASLRGEFRNVYASRFQHGLLDFNINREDQTVKQDRTSSIDFLKAQFDSLMIMNPEGSSVLVGGRYRSQMGASTRILIENENNPEKSYYSWESGNPDHFMLSETYCAQADRIIPSDSVIDYYIKEAAGHPSDKPPASSMDGKNELVQEEIDKLSKMTAEEFLAQLRKK
jgi:ssDNA-binding Zn-finger/Zn-ribbon topoisomerase 1